MPSERGLERYYLAELHRLRGELLRLTGDHRGLRAQLHRGHRFRPGAGREVSGAAGDDGARAPAAAIARGPMDGRALLSEIYGWFTEGHRTRDLIEAKGLIETLR